MTDDLSVNIIINVMGELAKRLVYDLEQEAASRLISHQLISSKTSETVTMESETRETTLKKTFLLIYVTK